MRCYRCGSLLTESDACPGCGTDVTFFKKIVALSNYHFNDGLKRAKIRDLSGAETSLLRSLKYNKRNVPARNLLGLIYYEEGRLGEALAEWIVSSNIMPQENPASEYMNELQADRNAADTVNRHVKHYNECLAYLHSDHEDLAFLQLKKLIAENTKLTDVYLLMSLLCMERGNDKTVAQCLKKALKLDRGCIKAQEYLTALREKRRSGADPAAERKRRRNGSSVPITYQPGEKSGTVSSMPTPRETSILQSILQVGIGLICGAAIVGFLILPAKIRAVRTEANQSTASYGDDITEKEAEIKSLNEKLKTAEDDKTAAETEKQNLTAEIEAYEKLLAYRDQYKEGSYNTTEITEYLNSLDKSTLGTQGQALYDYLTRNVVNASDEEESEE